MTYAAGDGAYGICSPDVNNDGYADLVTANWQGGNVSVLLNLACPFIDGVYPVNVAFVDTVGNFATDSDPTTIDTAAPTVEDAWVGSTHGSWALGDALFGSDDLLTGVVPWTRANQTGFRFSEDVYLGADPISFSASLREGVLDPGTASQPSQDEVVWTWSDPDGGLGGHLDTNWIKLDLNASEITDLAGNQLGDGADYLQSVKVLPGDVDGNGVVLSADRLGQMSSLGQTIGMPGYDPRADINGDGMVLSIDRLSLLGYLGQLVPPEPSDPGGGGEVLLGALSEGDWAGAGASPYTPNESFSPVNDGASVGKSGGFAQPALLREISVQLQRTSQESLTRTWRSLLDRNIGRMTRT